MQEEDWDCVFFHDVNLLPEDNRNLYICDVFPAHVSVAIDKFNYKLVEGGRLLARPCSSLDLALSVCMVQILIPGVEAGRGGWGLGKDLIDKESSFWMWVSGGGAIGY